MKKQNILLTSIVILLNIVPPAFSVPVHDVLVRAWDSSGNWQYFVDNTQPDPYAGEESSSFYGSEWICTWDIDASNGWVRSRQEVTRPEGSTYYNVCQSRIFLTDIFHINAGTSGLPDGTPVTVHIIGHLGGATWNDAAWAENGSTNADMYLMNLSTGNEVLFSHYVEQDCYDGAGTILYDYPFDCAISTTIGGSLTLSMGIGPSGRYCNPGTQTQGCERIPHSVGFDLHGQWLMTAEEEGLEITTDGGLPVPEPATICLLGLGALSLIRKKK